MALRTFTGRLVNPLDLREGDIDVHDIAHHLSMQCRFAGACKYHYSVAQHSVLLAHVVPYLMNQAGLITDAAEYYTIGGVCLLHDACEAYTTDIPTPVKQAVGFDERIEHRLLTQIFNKFNLPIEEYERIKIYDRRICENEKHALFSNVPIDPGVPLLPDLVIQAWTPAYAEKQFLQAFKTYVGEQHYAEH